MRATQVHKSQFNCDRTTTENGNARIRLTARTIDCASVGARVRDLKTDVEDHANEMCRSKLNQNEGKETIRRRTGYLMLGYTVCVLDARAQWSFIKLPLADEL